MCLKSIDTNNYNYDQVGLMAKAQASLEMVIGLIILLVVAAVVISLVLYYITPKKFPNPQDQLSQKQFLIDCEAKCNDLTTSDYCSTIYPGEDYNKDGINNDDIQVGEYKWWTCEKRVYCFLVQPCDRFGKGVSIMQRCKQILCQRFMEKYNNVRADATAELTRFVNFMSTTTPPGPCDATVSRFAAATENWYDNVFNPNRGITC